MNRKRDNARKDANLCFFLTVVCIGLTLLLGSMEEKNILVDLLFILTFIGTWVFPIWGWNILLWLNAQKELEKHIEDLGGE